MTLPVEIIEKILLNCDGKTLKAARHVCLEWRDIVNYLSQKTPIWQWCCKEEIPEKELIDYLDNYSSLDSERWQKIYCNWSSWQNLEEDIRFDIVSCPLAIPRISYIAVSGKYIAVGSDDGRVRVFTENWKPIHHVRHKAVKVIKINFIRYGEDREVCLVIAYPRSLVIDYFEKTDPATIIEDIKDHTVYKNYICYEKLRGLVSIVKLCYNGGTERLMEIWFSRIYSPTYPTCLNIWNGKCIFLINGEIQTAKYDCPDTPPISGLKMVTKLRSSLNVISEKSYQILRDDIIISLGKADSFAKEEFIEFFILESNRSKYSKKLFNTWEVLQSFITCIFVYGNTLVLGVDCGDVYFYNVSCWKYFDIRNYQKKIIIGKHPIISMDVKEIEGERKFYVASSFCIHEVTGYEVNIFF